MIQPNRGHPLAEQLLLKLKRSQMKKPTQITEEHVPTRRALERQARATTPTADVEQLMDAAGAVKTAVVAAVTIKRRMRSTCRQDVPHRRPRQPVPPPRLPVVHTSSQAFNHMDTVRVRADLAGEDTRKSWSMKFLDGHQVVVVVVVILVLVVLLVVAAAAVAAVEAPGTATRRTEAGGCAPRLQQPHRL